MEFKNILVPIDFSPSSARALEVAVSIARVWGATVTLLHVATRQAHDVSDALTVPQAILLDLRQRVDQEAREHLEALRHLELPTASESLELIRHDVVPTAIESRVVVRNGFPPEQIVEQVRAGSHDLVVMGTHGHTGVERVLLGSVAERVLRHASVPVFVTR